MVRVSGEGLGRRFAEAVDALMTRIVANPLAFPEMHDHTRRAVLTRFPYAIVSLPERWSSWRFTAARIRPGGEPVHSRACDGTRSLPRNFLRFLRNGSLDDLAGLAVDQLETEGGGALVESSEDA